MKTSTLIALMSLSEVAGMLGYAGFFAQTPVMTNVLGLTPAEMGWISSAFYGGYMIAVPILVTLTDRVDPRKIYLASMLLSAFGAFAFGLFADGTNTSIMFHALMGAGLAGTYMPGLRILTNRSEDQIRSTAIAIYTGTYAVGAAFSFLFIGRVSQIAGWRSAFMLAAIGPIVAALVVGSLVRGSAAAHTQSGRAVVLSNLVLMMKDRAVIVRSVAYAAHNFELFGFWSWAVAFLNFAYHRRLADGCNIDSTVVASALTLLLLPGSVVGARLAARFGVRRWIVSVMAASAIIGSFIGFLAGSIATPLLIGICFLYGFATAAESGALTGSLVHVSDQRYHGVALAVYSTIGFAGSCAGPPVFGVVLQYVGKDQVTGWGFAFVALSIGASLGPLVLLLFDQRTCEPSSLRADSGTRI